jgi:hypothetical protein
MSIEAMKQALEDIQQFKSLWIKVPAFGNKVNKATREAVSLAHNPIFQIEHDLRQAIAKAEDNYQGSDAAKAAHMMDLYTALGVRWGDNPFAVIAKMRSITELESQEPVAWMYDWTSDEGEFIQDWTTSMAETLRDTGKTVITNVRPLYSAPQVIHKPLQHFGEIPMAWCRWSEHLGKWMYTHRQPTEELAWIPLYDHPPQQRKPLTDEEIDEIWQTHLHRDSRVRAIEAAHGIKE